MNEWVQSKHFPRTFQRAAAAVRHAVSTVQHNELAQAIAVGLGLLLAGWAALIAVLVL